MQVTWWEADELCEHLRSREDLWTDAGDMWVRYARHLPEEDPIAVFALQVLPAPGTARFRQTTLHITPVVWDPGVIDGYLEFILRNFTTYGARLETQQLLTEELGVAPEAAEKGAVILAHVHNIGSVYGPPAAYAEPDPYPGCTPKFHTATQQRVLGQWPLAKGGIVRLCENGTNLLSVLLDIHGVRPDGLSLPDGDPPAVVAFRGMVRPLTANSLLHEHLYGYPEGVSE